MKISFTALVVFLLLSYAGLSQSGSAGTPTTGHGVPTSKLIHMRDQVFTDTSWTSPFSPDSVFVYYYNLRAKYPESSETLREKASEYILKTGNQFTGSGYITFRFFIDSTGQMQRRVEVLQTDAFYKTYYFQEGLVWALYDFLITLNDWKPAKAPKGFPPFYINVMTFKIHEGQIEHIIP